MATNFFLSIKILFFNELRFNSDIVFLILFFVVLNTMINFLRRVHRYYVVFIILFFFILFYPLYYLAAKKPEWYVFLNKLRTVNSKACSLFTGIFFRFTFAKELDKNQTYIYCGNHTSNLDIMIFCLLAKGRFHFMGKDDLLRNPVLKIFFNTIDIPVNRDSKMSSFRAFRRAENNLQNGMSLIIFPEGRINDKYYPPILSPFKSGPFRLAVATKIPLVPVSITDAWKKMWDNGRKYGTRPGICDIYVHSPISTLELEEGEVDSLRDTVFDLINSRMIKK